MAEAKKENITAESLKKGISNIRLTASAYFYKTNRFDVSARPWSKIGDAIKESVKDLARGTFKTDGWMIHQFGDNKTANYLICVYRLNDKKPPYAEQIEGFWEERKTGYVVLVAYNGYMAIQKRNAPISKCFAGLLTPLDYTALASLNSNSTYTKIHMKNLDGSNNVIRSKTLVANDLKESMPYMGANRYAINTINGKNNDDELFTISLSTSHIGESPEKLSILEFVEWTRKYIDAISSNAQPRIEDFLSVFATPLNYRKHAAQLIPTSILISRQEILDIIETKECSISSLKGDQQVNKDFAVNYINEITQRPLLLSAEQDNHYTAYNKGVTLHKRADYISIRGTVLDDVILSGTPDELYDGSLSNLIRQNHLFNVYFDDSSIIYTNGSLFQDHRLLNNAGRLLEVLDSKTIKGLAQTQSEKKDDSIFALVEETFNNKNNKNQYLICDDMGTEWADHIVIEEGKVIFIAEKFRKSLDSASDFQDVIGQALKNLGYFIPTGSELDSKQKSWNNKNTSSGLRHAPEGKTLDDAVEVWKRNINNPLYQKEMCLAVNFISESKFETDLDNALKKNIADANVKATTFQRLWLLSSFVNTCLESGVKPTIYCAP